MNLSANPNPDTTNYRHAVISHPSGSPAQNTSATNNTDNNPPIVPRRDPSSGYPAFPAYGYNLNGMSGMNPYQSFGYMGRYGANPVIGNVLPPVFNDIENVGRTAFQSFESIVQTISSVSMMLESTLFAVQNSVRAIVSVGQQFGNLRSHLVQNCMSFIRIIRYYFRKLLYLFNANKKAAADQRWNDAVHQTMHSKSNRNSILFFAFVIGTPCLMWKFIKSLLTEYESDSISIWETGTGEHYIGDVKFSYNAANVDELSIKSGDTIFIAPKSKQPQLRGWILASNGEKKGIVPANYIKIVGKGTDNKEISSKLKEIDENTNSGDTVKNT